MVSYYQRVPEGYSLLSSMDQPPAFGIIIQCPSGSSDLDKFDSGFLAHHGGPSFIHSIKHSICSLS